MHKSIKRGMLCLAVLAIGSAVSAGEPPVEGTVSLRAAGIDKNHQQVLIGPMEPGDNITAGGWRMKNFLITAAGNVQAKIGHSALVFGADAEIAGAKGDFTIHGQLPGKTDGSVFGYIWKRIPTLRSLAFKSMTPRTKR